MVKRLPRTWRFLALGLVAVIALVAVALFVVAGYTPTTTAYVQNDTTEAVTLDHCADTVVTIAAGARAQISPFRDASHAGCTVFQGESDLGAPIGCLYVPSSNGHTIAGAVVRVSTLRRASSGCRLTGSTGTANEAGQPGWETVTGWAFYLLLVSGGFASVVATTVFAYRRLRSRGLRDAALVVITAVVAGAAFLGLWVVADAYFLGRAIVRLFRPATPRPA